MPYQIAILTPNLKSGGVQRMMVLVSEGLAARGLPIDLVLVEPEGDRAEEPVGVRVMRLRQETARRGRLRAVQADPLGLAVNLGPVILRRNAFGSLRALRALAAYLRDERPAVLFAPGPSLIFGASLAKRLACSDVRLIASFRTHTSAELSYKRPAQRRGYLPALKRALAMADQLHAVSRSVAEDIEAIAGKPEGSVAVFPNPTLHRDIDQLAREPVSHPWLTATDLPVLLTVGRISPQKDQPTLLAGFAVARAHRPMRLLVIGEVTDILTRPAKRAQRLAQQVNELGIVADVAFVGFQANPFAWMARADLFVLTSRFEGLPNVVIEALACGCRIVATDAPGGTSEILDGGRYGKLVPVGDPRALGAAILEALDEPPEPEQQRARARAYDPDRALQAYLELLTGEFPPSAQAEGTASTSVLGLGEGSTSTDPVRVTTRPASRL
jgi:glycosyltransferase involved in cell wall biosynthesis